MNRVWGVVVQKQTTVLWRILIQILGFRCPVWILKTNRILIFSLRGGSLVEIQMSIYKVQDCNDVLSYVYWFRFDIICDRPDY